MDGSKVDPLSWTVLRIQPLARGRVLGSASAITVEAAGQDFLVTNWHVVAGRHADTGSPLDKKNAAIPDSLAVYHHDHHLVGRWRRIEYPLRGPDNEPLWREHPAGAGPGGVDVVALPIGRRVEAHIVPFPIASTIADVEVGMRVNVIGFPSGIGAAGNWPIWITGHMASEPDMDFDNRPVVLIDARTRGGMSGGPVVCRTSSVREETSIIRKDAGRPMSAFVGVYSGRVSDDLDIGIVWRPHVVSEVLSGKAEITGPRRFNAHVIPADEVLQRRAFDVDFDAPPAGSSWEEESQ